MNEILPEPPQAMPIGGVTRDADFLVVGIGASAGGLEACSKLLDGLRVDSGMAFILVQHLDPTHESLMVGLLASHTKLKVLQAKDGMVIEPSHLYVIPPGTYLSVAKGYLHVSPPQARHGARLPFDYLLQTLALDYGVRAACIILSGTGADGSIGLKAIKAAGGLVIAQEPTEAGFNGMPKSAIATNLVDQVLTVGTMPGALQKIIKWQPCTVTRLRWSNMQIAFGYGEISSGRDDIEMARFDQHALVGLQHIHFCVTGKQAHHQALMGWV